MSVNSDVSAASSVKHRDSVDYHPDDKPRGPSGATGKRASFEATEAISASEEENPKSAMKIRPQHDTDPHLSRMKRSSSIDSEATTKSVIVNHSTTRKSSVQGVEQYVQEISSAIHHLRTEYSEAYTTCVN